MKAIHLTCTLCLLEACSKRRYEGYVIYLQKKIFSFIFAVRNTKQASVDMCSVESVFLLYCVSTNGENEGLT